VPSPTSPLFGDALGPRGRRRVLVASLVSGVAVAGLVVLCLQRLSDRGQLVAEKWTRFFDPAVLRFLGLGLVRTLRLALLAMALALVIGLALALVRLARSRPLRWTAAAWIELFRGVPLVLLMFFAFLGAPRMGLDLSPFRAACLALVLYNSAVLAEIFRAGILSLERGQREAALGLGLSEGQAMRTVILPQALRRMVPAVVSQLVTLLKDTSLAVIVTYEDLLRRFQLAAKPTKVGQPGAELQAFVLAAAVYISINLCLSLLARRLEVRQRRRYHAGSIAVTGVEELAALGATSMEHQGQ
jgi:glutamate transport system permease protein